MSNEEAVKYLKQYPHWNIQEQNDILDSVDGWDFHRYICIMIDGLTVIVQHIKMGRSLPTLMI